MQFQQMYKFQSTEIDPNYVKYYADDGSIYFIAPGTWLWNDYYLPWLAAGNTPLGPDDPWPPLD